MEIQIFSNSKFGQLRVALNENGETVFCLADVCKALGLTNASMVKDRLDLTNLSSIEVCTKSTNRHADAAERRVYDGGLDSREKKTRKVDRHDISKKST